MDWHHFALFMSAWTLASFPLGVLVGRFISRADELDKALWRDVYVRQRALPAPPLTLMAPVGVPMHVKVALTA